jgi:hypothetical protein
MFKVVTIDGPNIVTDLGGICLVPSCYADGGKTRPVSEEDAQKMRKLFCASPKLLAALIRLSNIIVTIREEQVSGKMGLGNTAQEKRQRADVYAAEIARQALQIEDAMLEVDEAMAEAGSGSAP